MQVTFNKVKGQRLYTAEIADTTVSIKGVDDLFFIYSRKTEGSQGGLGQQLGFFNRLGDAKLAVEKAAEQIARNSR